MRSRSLIIFAILLAAVTVLGCSESSVEAAKTILVDYYPQSINQSTIQCTSQPVDSISLFGVLVTNDDYQFKFSTDDGVHHYVKVELNSDMPTSGGPSIWEYNDDGTIHGRWLVSNGQSV